MVSIGRLARCENIRQMLELGWRLLFAEECPRIDELCFDPDVSDPLPDSDSDSHMDHSDAESDASSDMSSCETIFVKRQGIRVKAGLLVLKNTFFLCLGISPSSFAWVS